jgi:phosphate transport system substrate-binding protein
MQNIRIRALAGASAFCAVVAMSASAHATIAGGGSTLLGPYWEQAITCYDADTTTYFYTKGTPVTKVTVNRPSSCAPPTMTGTIIGYDATGSGAGQAGLFANAAPIVSTTDLLFGSLDAAATQHVFGTIGYGLSDNALVGADLATYDVGTGASETVNFNGDKNTYTAPATYQTLTFSSAGTTTGGSNGTSYPVSKPRYGALIQFPVSVDPVALSYNPTYGSGSTFNVQGGDANGGLKLTAQAYCKIFTGEITNWNDAYLTSLNGGVSLTGGVSVPIKLVGRSDSSGTTSIFTRHLAAVCSVSGNLNSGATNPYTAGTTTIPTSVASLYTLVSGSGGVANAIHTTTGAIGYIGSDYTLPAVNNTHAVAFNLPVASLRNNAGNYEEPTARTALASFGAALPPQSSSDGSYNSTITTSDRRDPTQWVQSTAATAPLANPASTISNAYPIVGTTNFLAFSCYKVAPSVLAVRGIVNFVESSAGTTVLNNAGLGQLPANWIKAIQNTFLSTSGDASSLNLFATIAGSSSGNVNCRNANVVGG